jgi:lipopolysaccharide export system protein LptA
MTIRRGAGVAALLAAMMAFAAPLPVRADAAADIFAGFQAKSTDPVQVDADSLEVFEEGKQRISQFSGGVTVRRGNTLLKAGMIKLYSNLDAKAADAFTRIEASGKIYVSSGDQTVTGSSAVVDMVSNTITVSGGVVLSQGANVISGSRLVVNLTTGRARVEQEAGKQIRGVFSPGGANSGQ